MQTQIGFGSAMKHVIAKFNEEYEQLFDVELS